MIFSERIETLNWLAEALGSALKLKPNQLQIMHGGMADSEQQDIVDRFGRESDPMRVLLCSDVASEGLNLHYFCHRLVHFDLPWSLMVFQQRNGRVDRYGQKHQPDILYLFTETDVDGIKGDFRILEVLQTKDEQVNKNLGDPASFLAVHDVDKEEKVVTQYMIDGVSPEAVSADLDHNLEASQKNEADNLFDLFAQDEPDAPQSSLEQIHAPESLFDSDWQFAEQALSQIAPKSAKIQWQSDKDAQSLTLTAPRDLQTRLEQLPREAQRDQDRYTLCADRDSVALAIERARQAKSDENTWPEIDYLWSQHPIVEWLADRVLTAFGRHKAPVLRLPALAANEQAFILLGLIPNRKGQSVVVQWQVARRQGSGDWRLQPFEDFARECHLHASSLANAASELDISPLQAALPSAVRAMQSFMLGCHRDFEQHTQAKLASTLEQLRLLQDRQMQQLEMRLEASNQEEHFKRSRREQRERTIHNVFDDYRQWVEDTLRIEPEPYIQVLAAACR